MRGRIAITSLISIRLAVASAGVAAASDCKMVQIADWPVHHQHNQLIVDGTVNGQKVGIRLATGSQRSLILRSAAERLNLTRRQVRGGLLVGFGGETYDEVAVVDEFKIGAIESKGWQLPVASEHGYGRDVAIVLGDDSLYKNDVEFDLAHDAVRLFQTKNCDGASLAYWATEGASEVEIEAVSATGPQIVLTVQLNGQPTRALLDSGTSASVVNKSDAAQRGVTSDSPGVVRTISGSTVGNRSVESWIGPFQNFIIGNEAVKDTNIAVANLSWMGVAYTPLGSYFPQNVGWIPDMVLGADFLNAHRVLVAHSQRKLYFTYAGGPVFPAAEPAKLPAGRQLAPGKGDANPAVALTASGNDWRSKGDLDRAIADYDAAIRANPQYAVAFANRGLAKRDKGDVDGGIADLSRAIEINPKLAPAYVARGVAKLRAGDAEAAIVDYTHAIEIDPKLAAAYNSLAWALATALPPAVRDGRRAVETALKACELSEWKNPTYLDTLAASYARAGNFGDAVKWQHKALESPRPTDAEAFAQHLRLYEEGKPWPPD